MAPGEAISNADMTGSGREAVRWGSSADASTLVEHCRSAHAIRHAPRCSVAEAGWRTGAAPVRRADEVSGQPAPMFLRVRENRDNPVHLGLDPVK